MKVPSILVLSAAVTAIAGSAIAAPIYAPNLEQVDVGHPKSAAGDPDLLRRDIKYSRHQYKRAKKQWTQIARDAETMANQPDAHPDHHPDDLKIRAQEARAKAEILDKHLKGEKLRYKAAIIAAHAPTIKGARLRTPRQPKGEAWSPFE